MRLDLPESSELPGRLKQEFRLLPFNDSYYIQFTRGKTMIIRIKNLRLRTIVGFNDWERKDKQDVIINIEAEFEDASLQSSGESEPPVNYRSIAKRIISEVETADFYLLEKLATHLLSIVMEFAGVKKAMVEVDKPHALRFADSVSISCTAERHE